MKKVLEYVGFCIYNKIELYCLHINVRTLRLTGFWKLLFILIRKGEIT